jgi:hypothetical protein
MGAEIISPGVTWHSREANSQIHVVLRLTTYGAIPPLSIQLCDMMLNTKNFASYYECEGQEGKKIPI